MPEPSAGGFITVGETHRSNSKEQKKVGEGTTSNIVSFFAFRDKSVAPIERVGSHGCVLLGGRPAVETGCQHRRHAA